MKEKKNCSKEVQIINKETEHMENNYIENLKLKNAITRRKSSRAEWEGAEERINNWKVKYRNYPIWKTGKLD